MNDPYNLGPSVDSVDVLLVTVTKVEARAVLDAAKDVTGHDYTTFRAGAGNQTYYNLGIIGGAKTVMFRSGMGMSGPSGSIATTLEAIDSLSPSAVIMVGIAFGVDQSNQDIGDILVSEQISAYELQRVGTNDVEEPSQIQRGDRVSASVRLLDRFIDGEMRWQGPRVKFGLLLSGEKLVDNLAFRNRLLQIEPEAIGGEMEGAGLCSVAYRKKVDWILVKAICDWADGKKHENKKQNQEIAARNAASFTIHVIEQEGFAPDGVQESDRVGASRLEGRFPGADIPMPKVKRRFSQKEQDELLQDSFQTIKQYFRHALERLESEVPEVETSFAEDSSTKFTAKAYVQGQEKSRCTIWMGNNFSADAIFYREGTSRISADNSFNDWITVANDGTEMYLERSNMWIGHGSTANKRVNPEQAAEYLWRRFTSYLEY
jgi:nucleoside phosphorylase